jgi:hypothetical protein
MTTRPDVSKEFQRRRRETWRRIRWWMLLVPVSGGAFALGPRGSQLDLPVSQFAFQLVMFALFGTGIVVVIFIVLKHYRCPGCNAVPMVGSFEAGGSGFGYHEGVAFNPRVCSRCSARLR